MLYNISDIDFFPFIWIGLIFLLITFFIVDDMRRYKKNVRFILPVKTDEIKKILPDQTVWTGSFYRHPFVENELNITYSKRLNASLIEIKSDRERIDKNILDSIKKLPAFSHSSFIMYEKELITTLKKRFILIALIDFVFVLVGILILTGPTGPNTTSWIVDVFLPKAIESKIMISLVFFSYPFLNLLNDYVMYKGYTQIIKKEF